MKVLAVLAKRRLSRALALQSLWGMAYYGHLDETRDSFLFIFLFKHILGLFWYICILICFVFCFSSFCKLFGFVLFGYVVGLVDCLLVSLLGLACFGWLPCFYLFLSPA